VKVPKRDFSPRLGLAWRVTPTFVVRAGFGINFDPNPWRGCAISWAKRKSPSPPVGRRLPILTRLPALLKNGIPAWCSRT